MFETRGTINQNIENFLKHNRIQQTFWVLNVIKIILYTYKCKKKKTTENTIEECLLHTFRHNHQKSIYRLHTLDKHI